MNSVVRSKQEIGRVYNFINVVLIFCLFFNMFVGNGEIGSIPLFWVGLPMTFILLSSVGNFKGVSLTAIGIAAILILLQAYTWLLGYSLVESFQGNKQYWYWPTQALICLALVTTLMGRSLSSTTPFLPLAGFSLILGALGYFLLVLSDGRNDTFLFGPNVYYRIIAVSTLFSVYFVSELSGSRKTKYFLCFFFLAYSIFLAFQTGSRGAVPTVLVTIFSTFHILKPHSFSKNILTGFVVVLFIYSMLEYFGVLQTSRLFLLNVSAFDFGSSAGVRLDAWRIWLEDPMKFTLSSGISPEQYDSRYGLVRMRYPHNFILELLLYYGGIGLITTGVWFYVNVKNIKMSGKGPKKTILLFLYLGAIMTIGSFFSGDFRDNYSVLGLSFGIFIALSRSGGRRNFKMNHG